MEKKDISGKVRVNNASFNGVVNASSVDFKSSIVNNDNINACVSERGAAGFSPIANVVKSGDDVTITITDYKGTTTATIPDMSDEVERIESLIPHTASPTNKLVDSATLNSSVQTATSNFRGDWATYADIPTDVSLYPVDAVGVRTPSTNDYLVVMTDEEKNGGTWRYKYVGLWSVDGKNGWQAEYQVNETPFTADQLAAINSGITSELVEEIGQGGGGLEIGDIGIAPLGIDETKGKRRYLNGQLIIQEQYVQFTNKVKSAVALYPSLACTESEWQTTATMTVGGQVGKFVVDDEAGTIRLPKIIMPIQGLTDLSKLGEIVEAGLPNITAQAGVHQNQMGKAEGAFKFEANSSVPGHTNTTNTGQETLLFDASLSNPIYSNSNTVQQEQIQYPYFIQVATGAETEDNIINEIELNNPYSLLDLKWSDKLLNNISWLRSEGQANSKAVYIDVYELILREYNSGTDETETVGGVSITFRRGVETNIKVTTDKTAYDSILSATGTAWYYVLDTANEMFYLPQTDGFLQFGGDGNFVSAGLPNITGTTAHVYQYKPTGTGSGAFIYDNAGGGITTGSAGNTGSGVGSFDASRSNPIYGNSDTVQPNAVKGYLYFYVGETVQNANLINAGEVMEAVNKISLQVENTLNDTLAPLQTSYVIETYQNGKSWYRVYSDGWCEQGGELSSVTQNANTTVTLLKAFKDTNYAVLTNATGGSRANGQWTNCTSINSRSVSSFVILTYDYTFGRIWRASGYIA